MSAAAYLTTLNAEQRVAVEHGTAAGACGPCPPLLVVAGAGSGKTNTLAHRVASTTSINGPSFGLAAGGTRTYPGGAENRHIFDTFSRLRPNTRAACSRNAPPLQCPTFAPPRINVPGSPPETAVKPSGSR